MLNNPGFFLSAVLRVLNIYYFLQALVEVITTSDDYISVRATYLLGELQHMVSGFTSGNAHELNCPLLILLEIQLNGGHL